MAGAGTRWNRLYRILSLRFGPGAAKLPPGVTRIHLEFAKSATVNFGAWKFWKECVPRLKFHNPSIPMIINRDPAREVLPKMTLYFKNEEAVRPEGAPEVGQRLQPSSSAAAESRAQPPDWDEHVVKIDLDKMSHEAVIDKFMEATGAEPVLPNEEEQESINIMKRLDEFGKQLAIENKKKEESKRKEGAALKKALASGR